MKRRKMVKKLIIMRGFPASGKSTEAARIIRETPRSFLVSSDKMRAMFAGSTRLWHEMKDKASAEDKRRYEGAVMDTCHAAIRNILDGLDDCTVVFDAQNIRLGDIEALVMIAKDTGSEVETDDCSVKLDELLYRNSVRPKDERVPEKYIRSQYRKWHDSAFMPVKRVVDGSITLLDRMMDNPNVVVKKVKGEDDIYACNFTRDAFTKHKWDYYSSKARGLFLDHEGNVVMRGFDKFFNIGENEETSFENVMERMTYPARVERKENGFLGIIGAKGNGDPSFRFFSKAGNTDYSQLVRRRFEKVVPPGSDVENEVFTLMRRANASLVCEVIDTESDRHIIKYPESCIYALHLIRNDVDFEVLPVWEEILRRIASNMEWPDSFMVNSRDELDRAVTDAKTGEREGIVIYGADGYMCKLKSDHYLFIKSLRTSLQNAILGGKPPKKNDSVRYRVVTDILKNSDKTKLVYRREAFDKDDIDMTYVSEYLQRKGISSFADAEISMAIDKR